MNRRKAIVTQAKAGRYAKQWTFNLIGDNGEPVATSGEWYKNYDDMFDTLTTYFPGFRIVRKK